MALLSPLANSSAASSDNEVTPNKIRLLRFWAKAFAALGDSVGSFRKLKSPSLLPKISATSSDNSIKLMKFISSSSAISF
jgi:hypothetical protein